MTKKIIVILGLTGAQGSSVANTFLIHPNWHIRGITRDISKPSAQSWAARGVELFQADLNTPSTLTTAFTGAHVIFSVTNYYDSFYNPATSALLAPGQTINEYCYEEELRQGKGIVDVAAGVEGLERFVVSGSVDAERLSGGKYKGVYHFDSKARAVTYVTERYPELEKKMSMIAVGSYMENWRGELKLQKDQDGAFHIALPGIGLKQVPQMNVAADLGNIVYATVQASPGKRILGVSSMLSWTDMLKVWCEINKVPFGGYHSVPVSVFEKFIPVPGLGREIGDMMAFIDDFGYTGGDETVILPGDLGVPCPLTSWEEFVRKEDWTKVLEG